MIKKKTRIVVLTLVVIALAVIAAISFGPHVMHCIAVPLSSFENMGQRIFVDAALTQQQWHQVSDTITAAQTRVSVLFGDLTSRPTYIVCGSADSFERFAGVKSTFSLAQMTPFGTYIVLGPDGLNLDLVSHELTHAELLARVGYWRFGVKQAIPWWFLEGMATFNDYREDLSESKYQEYLARGIVPGLSNIATSAEFNASNGKGKWLAYVTAKHEFTRWYGQAGREGLLTLLERVRSGELFEMVYQQIDRNMNGQKNPE